MPECDWEEELDGGGFFLLFFDSIEGWSGAIEVVGESDKESTFIASVVVAVVVEGEPFKHELSLEAGTAAGGCADIATWNCCLE